MRCTLTSCGGWKVCVFSVFVGSLRLENTLLYCYNLEVSPFLVVAFLYLKPPLYHSLSFHSPLLYFYSLNPKGLYFCRFQTQWAKYYFIFIYLYGTYVAISLQYLTLMRILASICSCVATLTVYFPSADSHCAAFWVCRLQDRTEFSRYAHSSVSPGTVVTQKPWLSNARGGKEPCHFLASKTCGWPLACEMEGPDSRPLLAKRDLNPFPLTS